MGECPKVRCTGSLLPQAEGVDADGTVTRWAWCPTCGRVVTETVTPAPYAGPSLFDQEDLDG